MQVNRHFKNYIDIICITNMQNIIWFNKTGLFWTRTQIAIRGDIKYLFNSECLGGVTSPMPHWKWHVEGLFLRAGTLWFQILGNLLLMLIKGLRKYPWRMWLPLLISLSQRHITVLGIAFSSPAFYSRKPVRIDQCQHMSPDPLAGLDLNPGQGYTQGNVTLGWG